MIFPSIDEMRRAMIAGGISAEGKDPVRATQAGIDALGTDFEPLPTGEALRAHWLQQLGGGELKLLQAVLDAHPGTISREQLQEATGYKATSTGEYLKLLRARKLVVDVGRGEVRASDNLF